jgi:repressor LexA
VVTTELTQRQQDVYSFICAQIRDHGYGPTVREICQQFGIRSPNGVVCHLKSLERKGLIRRLANKSRAIELTNPQDRMGNRLPLRGRIAAGALHEAIEQESEIDFSQMFAKNRRFVLQTHGDSMIEAHIQDGDFVVVEPRDHAANGEMVVAMTEDGSATLKYWFRESNRIRLQPANRTMKPLYVDSAKILGIVVGIVRAMA